VLQNIARLTGGSAITEGFDLQLKSIQMSDLGYARKITVDKNKTVIEVGVKHDWLSLEAKPCARANANISSVQSSRTHANPARTALLAP
jgi:chaperonin GroEL